MGCTATWSASLRGTPTPSGGFVDLLRCVGVIKLHCQALRPQLSFSPIRTGLQMLPWVGHHPANAMPASTTGECRLILPLLWQKQTALTTAGWCPTQGAADVALCWLGLAVVVVITHGQG